MKHLIGSAPISHAWRSRAESCLAFSFPKLITMTSLISLQFTQKNHCRSEHIVPIASWFEHDNLSIIQLAQPYLINNRYLKVPRVQITFQSLPLFSLSERFGLHLKLWRAYCSLPETVRFHRKRKEAFTEESSPAVSKTPCSRHFFHHGILCMCPCELRIEASFK